MNGEVPTIDFDVGMVLEGFYELLKIPREHPFKIGVGDVPGRDEEQLIWLPFYQV